MHRPTRYPVAPFEKLAIVLVLGAACAAASSRSAASDLPEGMLVGPWILAPSLTSGFAYDTNVFLASSTSTSSGTISDRVLRVTPGLVAALPFRESLLKLDYSVTRLDYGKTPLERNLSRDAGIDLALNFSTQDRLSLRANRNLGVAETLAFDPGGEVVFRGQGFDLTTYEIEAAREVFGHRGYRVRLSREALSFDPGTTVAFFEFRGIDAEVDYREPLSPRFWAVGDYEGRRYDHFLADEPTGSHEPFRKEDSDVVRVGLQGQLGEREPFLVRVGWGRFRFPGSEGSEYRGIVADASLVIRSVGRTELELGLQRRPWPSFFLNNNYYLVNSANLRLSRRWLQYSTMGIEGWWQEATYGDPVPMNVPQQPGLTRVDRTLRASVYANLMIRERLGVRISVDENHRNSNYLGAGFEGRVYFAGIVLGWI